jgi:hypothetical protein
LEVSPVTDTITLKASNGVALQENLANHGISSKLYQQKSISEVQMLVVALGGGVGIAAMIKALGDALKSYFEGASELEKARAVIVSAGGISITATPNTIGDVLRSLPQLLDSSK